MSIATKLLLFIYLGHGAESRSFYNYNDYPPQIKYNEISDEVFDEVHEDHSPEQQPENHNYNQPTPSTGYRYEYHINSPYTGDYKTQQEERVGDVVRGSYSFIEPDGRKRIVEYTADPIHGFNAIVKHEPANALHLQRSISDHELATFHLHPRTDLDDRRTAITPSHLNFVPTLPPPKPTWNAPKKLFHTKPPTPLPPPVKSNSTSPYFVPARSQQLPNPYVSWPFLYGV